MNGKLYMGFRMKFLHLTLAPSKAKVKVTYILTMKILEIVTYRVKITIAIK